jgi:hypothetical protein|nr:MAG TPA: hypothetical protein [Caudoviricetes sp.]
MNEKKQLDFLNVLSLISFALQIKTVENTFTIEDIQKDNDRIMQELHKHMEEQDKKINEIWEVLHNGKIR